MPRLLLISERFPLDIGGVASSAERISQALCIGIEVDVLAWSRYLKPGEVLPPNPQPTHTPHLYRVGQYRHWDLTMPHTLNILDWLHQSRNYAAIWGHYLFPSVFLATWFAKLNGIQSTVSARGNDIDRAMFPPGDFARLQWTLSNADVVTAVSTDLAKKIQLLAQREDVLILKNAVDGNIFSPSSKSSELRRSPGIAENEAVASSATSCSYSKKVTVCSVSPKSSNKANSAAVAWSRLLIVTVISSNSFDIFFIVKII